MPILIYSSSELLAYKSATGARSPASLRWRLGHLFAPPSHRRTGRGCRGGQRRQRPISVIVPSDRRHSPRSENNRQPTLVYPKIERHANPPTRRIRAGLLNIRSVNSKIENIPDLLDEFELNALILTETWHENADSVAIRRLRSFGLNVIEAARALSSGVDLDNIHFVNHGGLAVISRPGTTIAKVDTKLKLKTFEHLCCRIGGGGSTPQILVAIYRPGSQRVRDPFFTELSTLLESLSTFNCRIIIAGDLNIHLECPTDSDSQKLMQLIGSFGLQQHVRDSTHERGGLLDVVITSHERAPDDVTAEEVGLSDHKLIHWTLPIEARDVEYTTITRRSWRHFKLDQFVEQLERSPLCAPTDPNSTATDLACCFQSVITSILDDLAPMSELSVRPRIHRPFYDDDCRQARRRARRLERNYRKKKGTDAESNALSAWREALKASRGLVRMKGRQYWNQVIDSAHADTKRTWQHLDSLLGRNDPPSRVPSSFTAEDFHSFIDDKVTNIRDRTADAGPATYHAYTGPSFLSFTSPTLEEVVASVKSSPNKQCSSDPLPMWLLKDTIATLAPFLTALMTASIANGEFPQPWKHAVIRPHLKRPGLDLTDPANFRPVANLPFLSKLLERLANNQLIKHLASNGLMPRHQSAYRAGHSTETALLRIVNDIIDAIANGEQALLCLLDLSAAFDTVDHTILVRRLELSFGIKGVALSWLRDYLSARSQSVTWGSRTSVERPVRCGVPQGSVLGPLLFVLYVGDVGRIVDAHGFASHTYADDGQVYSSCPPSESERLRTRLQDCFHEIMQWTASNRLALNPEKTELLWISTPRKAHLISRTPFTIGGTVITPSTEVRLLGVLLDASLSFVGHVNAVTRACYFHLRKIREIRRYIPTSAAIHLVRALVLTRLDYCNGILLGLPDSQLSRLQSVLNSAARMIFGARWRDHVTPLLRDNLHWLRIPERIIFKRCWLTFRALNDPSCPEYLSTLIRRPTPTDRRLHLRSSNQSRLYVPPPSKTVMLGERSVTRGNPLLWNALPESVTATTVPETFASNLKTYLFRRSYEISM